MESEGQTRIDQIFSARKRSAAGSHPSKRRKIDTSVPSKSQLRMAKSSVRPDMAAAVQAKSNTRKSSESTSTVDDHNQTMRKTTCAAVRPKPKPEAMKPAAFTRPVPVSVEAVKPVASPSKSICSPLRPAKSTDQENICKLLPVDSWVNEQAKTVLHSRGSTLLRASLNNTQKSPMKASLQSLMTSPMKSPLKSPVKLNLTPTKSNMPPPSPVKILQQLTKADTSLTITNKPTGRGSLRSKFASQLSAKPSLEPSQFSSPAKENTKQAEGPIVVKTTDTSSRARSRLGHLAAPTVTTTLKLPAKYRQLTDTFRCADSVLFLLSQRKESCTWDRLKQSVQKMSGRNFELTHLAKFKTVLPTTFNYRQEKGLYMTTGGKSQTYQLVIEGNFQEAKASKSVVISSTVLITRRLMFETSLVNITRQHHQKFLRKLNLSLAESEIQRWHPNFPLDSVPDIEQAALPQAPTTKTFSSAMDVMHMSRGNLTGKVQKALEFAADKTEQEKSKISEETASKVEERLSAPNETKEKKKNDNLKGVSQSLVERIRLKEQRNAELLMTRDTAKDMRLSMMERLPDIARILKTFFTTEKKGAITLEDCLHKLQDSHITAVSTGNMEKHIILLAELVPSWMTMPTVRGTLYVKIVKSTDINQVVSMLDEAKQLESAT